MTEVAGGAPEGEAQQGGWLHRLLEAFNRVRRRKQEAQNAQNARQLQELEDEAEAKRRELEEEIQKHQRREPDADETRLKELVGEVSAYARNQLYDHSHELTKLAVVAAAEGIFRLPPRQALLVAEAVDDIVHSQEFRDAAAQGGETLRNKMREVTARLRSNGANDVAHDIDRHILDDARQEREQAQKGDGETPDPGTGEGGDGGERPPDGETPDPGETPERPQGGNNPFDDEEPERIEEFIERTGYRTRDGGGWMDIFRDDPRGTNYMRPEFQKSLVGIAIRSQIQLTRDKQVLLRSLDGGREFEAYFKALGDMMMDEYDGGNADPDGPTPMEDDQGNSLGYFSHNDIYKRYQADIKDTINELLSSMGGTADSSKKEIQFIGNITDKIVKTVRREIEGNTFLDNERGEREKIQFKSPIFIPDRDGITEPGEIMGVQEYVEERVQYASLSQALEDDLAGAIGKLTKLTMGLHNGRYVAYEADKFEDLTAQIKNDGIKINDMQWLFSKEDDVRVAYNFFIHALEQVKAQTGRTITQRYGAMSKKGGMTEVEERAYMQMLASDDDYRTLRAEVERMRGLDTNAMTDDDRRKLRSQSRKLDKLKRQKARAVKLASGVAWGFSMESWGILLDAKLLTVRKGVEGDYETTQHYGSSQQKGLEKLLAQLHPEVNDNRWGRDKMKPIWMLYQPRDLDMEKSTWARDEVYTHSRLYELYDKHDRAFYSGRDDDLADFDDKYVTMHEFANVTQLSMLKRESWRLKQHLKNVGTYTREAESEGLSGIDLHESVMKKLMLRGGPRLVKMYIDNKDVLKDLMKLKGHYSVSMRAADRIQTAQSRSGYELPIPVLGDKERKIRAKGEVIKREAKAKYYKEYIMDELESRFASSFIALEQPRYMPNDEGTLYSQLNKYLASTDQLSGLPPTILQTELYPVFVDAVHMVERYQWENARDQGDIDRPQQIDESTFDIADVEQRLRDHFELYKDRIGTITDFDAEMGPIKDLTFEEYHRILKGFHKTLITEVTRDDRYNRTKKARNKKKQSLSERYAHMLSINQGGVNQMMGGSYFDFSLDIQQGGVDAINRLGSDVMKSVNMAEAWDDLAGDGGEAEKFMMAGYEDDDAEGLQSGAAAIAEKINEICKYPYSNSPDEGNMYKIRQQIFWGRAFSKPEVFRNGVFGPMAERWMRTAHGSQSNLFAEYYQQILGRTDVTSLDGDQLRVVIGEWEKKLRVPRKRYEAEHYESVDDMNIARRTLRKTEDGLRHIPVVGAPLRGIMRTLTTPITESRPLSFKTHEYNQDQVFRELAATERDILVDKLVSFKSFAAAAFFLYLMVKAADEKNKEVAG